MRRRPFSRQTLHLGAVRLGVLDGVGQRLGDGEVGGQLDRGGQAPVEVDLDPGRQRRARGQRADRLAQAALGEQRGADAAGEVAQLAHRELGLAARLLHELAGALGVAVEALLGHAQVEGEGDEARLGAVVQVALDAVQLGGGGVDGTGARLGQDLDALLELAAAGAEHDPRERAAGGRRAAHQRGGDGQQDDADRHGEEGVAPRVDLEEAELGGIGVRQRPPPGGHDTSPSDADHAVTAMVKSAMPTGSSSRCQPRSFHVEGSEKSALRRATNLPFDDR